MSIQLTPLGAYVKVSPLLSSLPLTLAAAKSDRSKIKKSLDWLRTTTQEYIKKGVKGGTKEEIAAEGRWLDIEGELD